MYNAPYGYEEVSKDWDIKKLLLDLKFTDYDMQSICCLLIAPIKQAEIAKILNIAEGTVRNKLNKLIYPNVSDLLKTDVNNANTAIVALKKNGYWKGHSSPPSFIDVSKEKYKPIGWIFLGVVPGSTRPKPLAPLQSTFNNFLTISPNVLPFVGDLVKLSSGVRIRETKPEPKKSDSGDIVTYLLGKELGILDPFENNAIPPLLILDLEVYKDYDCKEKRFRVHAQVAYYERSCIIE